MNPDQEVSWEDPDGSFHWLASQEVRSDPFLDALMVEAVVWVARFEQFVAWAFGRATANPGSPEDKSVRRHIRKHRQQVYHQAQLWFNRTTP